MTEDNALVAGAVFVRALKQAKYFTANEDHYRASFLKVVPTAFRLFPLILKGWNERKEV
jgi:hypothetical protein